MTLFSRSAGSLKSQARVETVGASVFDKVALEKALTGTDLVFVALSGDLSRMMAAIIAAMKVVGTKRLIFTASYGIYGELPGQDGRVADVLIPYRQAADLLEASDLDYTILRPGWFDNSSDRSYTLIPKGQVIVSNHILRLGIADFVKEVALAPENYCRANVGIVRDEIRL